MPPRLPCASAESGLSSNARRQQASDSSSLPCSLKISPRLLCASAKSGFNSSARRKQATASSGLAQVLQGNTQVVVCLGIIRPQFQRPAITGDRLVQFSLLLEGNAEVVVPLGRVRLQFQGPTVATTASSSFPLSLNACPGCRVSRQSPASVPVPGGSRRSLRPAFLAPSTHCPGCCVPRHSPA